MVTSPLWARPAGCCMMSMVTATYMCALDDAMKSGLHSDNVLKIVTNIWLFPGLPLSVSAKH